MQLNVVLDTHLRFNKSNLDPEVLDKVLSYLTITNPAKARAESEMVWNAYSLPDTIELWDRDYDVIILPRGFVHEFEHILKDNDIEIKWIDNTIQNLVDHKVSDIPLRDYQLEASSKLIFYSTGIYKSETGTGKTRVMLSVILEGNQKTIVIVEKKDLVFQWKKAAEELGFTSIGIIGGGKFEDKKDLVLATRQSLWSCRESLQSKNWYTRFGMLVVDEVHHVSSSSMWDLAQRFPAYYRYGCSATPDSDPAIFPIARAVIGPVVHQTLPEKAKEALVIPKIRVVDTDFEFDYRPTQRGTNPKTGKSTIIRNNYGKMMSELQQNRKRNELLISIVAEEFINNHSCLVLSKRKEHLNYLLFVLNQELPNYSHYPTMILTGDNTDEYDNIKSVIENSEKGSILFSTLAEEGTDIPRLDRLFLAYPGRKSRGYEQAIGRIMRKHPLKKDAIVYDFRDPKVTLLKSQFRERSQQIYGKKNYDVEFI